MTISPRHDRLDYDGEGSQQAQARLDERFMAAAIRFARKHEGLTADNPSVGALIVRFDELMGREEKIKAQKAGERGKKWTKRRQKS